MRATETNLSDPDASDPGAMLSLSEPLESPEKRPPAGSSVDLEALKGTHDRSFNNRARLQDRFHQLPIYGEARLQAEKTQKARWKITGRPSDHPLVQTILAIRMDEDELVAMKADLDPKEYLKLKLAVKSKIADLLISLQKENDQIHKEIMEFIALDQRQKEHADKMSIASGKKDEDAADAEILARAKKLGIEVNE